LLLRRSLHRWDALLQQSFTNVPFGEIQWLAAASSDVTSSTASSIAGTSSGSSRRALRQPGIRNRKEAWGDGDGGFCSNFRGQLLVVMLLVLMTVLTLVEGGHLQSARHPSAANSSDYLAADGVAGRATGGVCAEIVHRHPISIIVRSSELYGSHEPASSRASSRDVRHEDRERLGM
jgi:hypothetical protein